MTWGQFKAQINALEIPDDMRLGVIDVNASFDENPKLNPRISESFSGQFRFVDIEVDIFDA